MTRLGSSLLEQLLGADTGHRGQRIDCGQGHCAWFVGYRDKNLDTVLDRVRLLRAYYHCRTCGRGMAPRDGELGVTDASLSPGPRRMVARAAAAQPFAGAGELLAELAGVQLTPKRIERSAETDGTTAATRIAAEAPAIAHRAMAVLPVPADRGQAPDKLYIAIDGTGVPMVPAAVRDRAGNNPDGRAPPARSNWPACSPRPPSTRRAGRCATPTPPPMWVASPPAEAFATLVHAEARRRGADHIRQLVVLGDGAPWIGNLATAILPEATPIVDLYHARQHVHDLAGQLAPALGEHHSDWRPPGWSTSTPATSKRWFNNRSGSTPVTRNEVCMKPGVVQGSAALVRAVRVSAIPRDEIEEPGALCTTFWRCW